MYPKSSKVGTPRVPNQEGIQELIDTAIMADRAKRGDFSGGGGGGGLLEPAVQALIDAAVEADRVEQDEFNITTFAPLGATAGAPGAARVDAVVTTPSLAVDGLWSGLVTMGADWRLYKVLTDRPARVRLYSSVAALDADVGRAIGVDPVGDHGLMAEFVSTEGSLGASMAPIVDGAVIEDPVTDQVPISIINLTAGASTVVATLTYLKTE